MSNIPKMGQLPTPASPCNFRIFVGARAPIRLRWPCRSWGQKMFCRRVFWVSMGLPAGCLMENPTIKWLIWGYPPHFRETPMKFAGTERISSNFPKNCMSGWDWFLLEQSFILGDQTQGNHQVDWHVNPVLELFYPVMFKQIGEKEADSCQYGASLMEEKAFQVLCGFPPMGWMAWHGRAAWTSSNRPSMFFCVYLPGWFMHVYSVQYLFHPGRFMAWVHGWKWIRSAMGHGVS